MKSPSGGGSSIGVVLYQKAFFVGKASYDRSLTLLQREPYPTGGMTVSWEGSIQNAYT